MQLSSSDFSRENDFTPARFRRILAIVFVVAVAIALLFNGRRSLWDTSETRYAEATQEMVNAHEWLVPMIAGQPHLTKPPVAYWIYGASMSVLGKAEWAVRFPCAIAFALSVLVTGLLAAELTRSRITGVIAAMLQVCAPLALVGSHVVTTDIFLAAEEPAIILAAILALHADSRGRARGWTVAAWLLCSLAFMTKGPPALLCALALIIFCVVRRRQYEVRRLLYLPALVAFVVLSCAWYVVVLIRVPDSMRVWSQEALQKVFIKSDRNMPAIYYPFLLTAGALPATVALFRYCWTFLPKVSPPRWKHVLRAWHQSPPAVMLCTIWIIVPLIIFMIAKTRLPLYVIPLVAPLNILGAMVIARRLPTATSNTLWRAVPGGYKILGTAVIATFLVVKVALFIVDDESKDMRPLARAIAQDARAHDRRPHVFLTMTRMGNGILYYLGGPPATRMLKNEQLAADPELSPVMAKIPPPNRPLKAQAFTMVIQPGQSLYIVMDTKDQQENARGVKGMYTLIYENSHWAVWRRSAHFVLPAESDPNSSHPLTIAPG